MRIVAGSPGAIVPFDRIPAMKRFALVILLVIAAVLTAAIARAPGYGVRAPVVAPVEPVAVPDAAVERLAGSLRFPTISHEDPTAIDAEAFVALHAYLERSFPRVFAALEGEVVNGYSLLLRWRGSDASLAPVLLMGHLDVVPVEPGTEGDWTHPPFSGVVSDGYVWGRGALDDKVAVLGILEAVEMLLAEGFEPRRTLYLAFGHDEEVGGAAGAVAIVRILKERGVRLAWVLDEGGIIARDVLPVSPPVALVGIAEKGYAAIELVARAEGGHSSMPPRQTAIGVLGAALARLEANPMPARLEGATAELFRHLGPELPYGHRLLFANQWLTRPLLERALAASPRTAAQIRTTIAPTMIEGGIKANVLPSHASAVVNVRIAPGDDVEDVLAHVRETIADPRVEVRLIDGMAWNPSPVSGTDTEGFEMIRRTILETAPGTRVAPYLLLAATDSRHFHALTDDVYRFLPVVYTAADLDRLHGTDERISIEDYHQVVRFFHRLIQNTAGSPLTTDH